LSTLSGERKYANEVDREPPSPPTKKGAGEHPPVKKPFTRQKEGKKKKKRKKTVGNKGGKKPRPVKTCKKVREKKRKGGESSFGQNQNMVAK